MRFFTLGSKFCEFWVTMLYQNSYNRNSHTAKELTSVFKNKVLFPNNMFKSFSLNFLWGGSCLNSSLNRISKFYKLQMCWHLTINTLSESFLGFPRLVRINSSWSRFSDESWLKLLIGSGLLRLPPKSPSMKSSKSSDELCFLVSKVCCYL